MTMKGTRQLVLVFSTLVGQVSADGGETFDRLSRLWGFGWSDGYHACSAEHFHWGENLPPRSFATPVAHPSLPLSSGIKPWWGFKSTESDRVMIRREVDCAIAPWDANDAAFSLPEPPANVPEASNPASPWQKPAEPLPFPAAQSPSITSRDHTSGMAPSELVTTFPALEFPGGDLAPFETLIDAASP